MKASIFAYVVWQGHDCDGTMPAVDVLAGVLATGGDMSANAAGLEATEALVLVPPQWLGAWDDGRRLAPCYQHIWRVPLTRLFPLPAHPRGGPYRPATLPASATGPSLRRRPRPTRDWSSAKLVSEEDEGEND